LPVLALIEMRAEDVQSARKQLEKIEYVMASYELMSRLNIAVIVEVESEQALFEFLELKVRTIPGIKETKTHVIQNGIAF